MSSGGAKLTCDKPHVFISGLARAGTTIFLRALYQTGIFRSLTYRDMPFVLMPNIWKRLSKSFRTYLSEKERAHGDRILVNYDSPEAFEEVFWRIFCGKEYIFSNSLQPHDVEGDIISDFRQFVEHIVTCSDNNIQTRYLSKNNNNILRLRAIKKAFPNSLITILFRDPLQQSYSLLKQHRLFSELHKEDSFSYDYMTWLGHHEFGKSHKPFRFSSGDSISETFNDPYDINYWLQIWCNTYNFIIENCPEETMFISYEALCNMPLETIDKVFSRASIKISSAEIIEFFRQSSQKTIEGVEKNLEKEARVLYEMLNQLSIE